MWQFEYQNKFIKQYKKLNSALQETVKKALTEMANSDNPLKLGNYKKHLKAFAYDLDSSNRILYNVRFPDNMIELIRVGNHKQVYGTD